jgi:hypothetical protein
VAVATKRIKSIGMGSNKRRKCNGIQNKVEVNAYNRNYTGDFSSFSSFLLFSSSEIKHYPQQVGAAFSHVAINAAWSRDRVSVPRSRKMRKSFTRRLILPSVKRDALRPSREGFPQFCSTNTGPELLQSDMSRPLLHLWHCQAHQFNADKPTMSTIITPSSSPRLYLRLSS